MAIAKRPQNVGKTQQPSDVAAEAFIQGAAHTAATNVQPVRRRKERVMVQFSEQVLDRVDKAAERRGISRSAWIQYVVSRALDQGEG